MGAESRFKAGDMARCVAVGIGWTIKVGDVLRVTAVNGMWLEFSNGWSYADHNFALADAPAAAPAEQPKEEPVQPARSQS